MSSTAMDNPDRLFDRITLFDKTVKTYTEVREIIKTNLPEKVSDFVRKYRRTPPNITLFNKF